MKYQESMVISNSATLLWAIAYSIVGKTQIKPDPVYGHPQILINNEVVAIYSNQYLIK